MHLNRNDGVYSLQQAIFSIKLLHKGYLHTEPVALHPSLSPPLALYFHDWEDRYILLPALCSHEEEDRDSPHLPLWSLSIPAHPLRPWAAPFSSLTLWAANKPRGLQDCHSSSQECSFFQLWMDKSGLCPDVQVPIHKFVPERIRFKVCVSDHHEPQRPCIHFTIINLTCECERVCPGVIAADSPTPPILSAWLVLVNCKLKGVDTYT